MTKKIIISAIALIIIGIALLAYFNLQNSRNASPVRQDKEIR